MTEEKKIKNIVLCGIIKNNKILLILRNRGTYTGYWAIVGGKIEFGEHVEEAAIRECKEETGINTKFECIAGIASEIVYQKQEKTNQFILFVTKLNPKTTKYKESDEGKLKWFDLNKLDKKRIVPSDYIMIQEYLKKNNSLKIHKVKVKQEGETYEVEEFI